jgi:hypothetical protein
MLACVCVTAEFDRIRPFLTISIEIDTTSDAKLNFFLLIEGNWQFALYEKAELICQLDNYCLKRHHGFTLSNSS